MKHPLRIVLLLLVAAIGAGAWYWGSRAGEESIDEAPVGGPDAMAPPPQEEPVGEEGNSGVGAQFEESPESGGMRTTVSPGLGSATESGRTALAAAALQGVVLDPERNPIEGAIVTWSPLPAGWHTAIPPNNRIDAQWISRATLESTSDASGAYSFFARPAGNAGSVLWATHTGYMANCIVLDEPVQTSGMIEIELQGAAPIEAFVVKQDDDPVPRATVVHRGVVPDPWSIRQQPTREEYARALLLRSGSTDDRGRLLLGAFPGRQELRASLDTLSSPPWSGDARSQVVLRLNPECRFEGTVFITPADGIEGELHIEVGVRRGSVRRSLETLTASPAEGSAFRWGPVRVPIVDGDAYFVRMEGGRAIPQQVERPIPHPGENVFVELRTSLGNDLWFALADERKEDELLRVGEVLLKYRGSESTLRGVPRADGYILIRGCPEGVADAHGHSPGYSPGLMGPIIVPEIDPSTGLFTLSKSGRIEGRCMAGGAPVRDFQVVFWNASQSGASRLTRRDFVDREDGSFELNEALGKVMLVAVAPGHPFSAKTMVEVAPGEVAKAQLLLEAGPRIGGRVVDEEGAAIPGARIRPMLEEGLHAIADWGPVWQVEPDGTFLLDAVPTGRSLLRIDAPGFSALDMPVTGETGQSLQLGQLVLTRQPPLEVALEHEDPRLCKVGSTHSDARLPSLPFSADGIVVYPFVDLGEHILQVQLPDLSYQEKRVDVEAGAENRTTFYLNGAAQSTCELELGPGEPERIHLRIGFWDTDGDWNTRFFSVLEAAPVTLEWLPVGVQVEFELIREGYKTLDRQVLTLEEGNNHVRLAARERAFKFRVVDPEGKPVSEVRVVLYETTGSPFTDYRFTDGDGFCTFEGLPETPLLASLTHAVRGYAWELPVPTPLDEAVVTELLFNPLACLEAIFLDDDDKPVSGLKCELHERQHYFLVGDAKTSDATGRARWDRLGEGTYRLSVRHPEYWPIETDLEIRAGDGPQELPVTRVATLELQVRTQAGLPVASVPITVESVDYGTSIAPWIAAGYAKGPESLTTDAAGNLRIEGLPHGEYRWTITRDGQDHQASGIALAGQVSTFTIRLP